MEDSYTQGGHKLRFFRRGKAQFVTVGIISITSELQAIISENFG